MTELVENLNDLLNRGESTNTRQFLEKAAELLVPAYLSDEYFMIAGTSSIYPDQFDFNEYSETGLITAKEPIHIRYLMLEGNGQRFVPVFSGQVQAQRVAQGNVILGICFSDLVDQIIEDESITGLVIDPLGCNIMLSRHFLKAISILANDNEENDNEEEEKTK